MPARSEGRARVKTSLSGHRPVFLLLTSRRRERYNDEIAGFTHIGGPATRRLLVLRGGRFVIVTVRSRVACHSRGPGRTKLLRQVDLPDMVLPIWLQTIVTTVVATQLCSPSNPSQSRVSADKIRDTFSFGL